MEERKKEIRGIIGKSVLFFISMALVIAGQQKTGPKGLLVMLLGIAGLIVLLWMYNKNFRK